MAKKDKTDKYTYTDKPKPVDAKPVVVKPKVVDKKVKSNNDGLPPNWGEL